MKVFLFEIQLVIKNFAKKIKNILVVSEKAVTLHPQSREVACELKKQTFERKNKYFFLKYFVSSKKCRNFAVRFDENGDKFFERLKTTKM